MSDELQIAEIQLAEKGATVSREFVSAPEDVIGRLSFSHICEIEWIDDPLVRYFYEQECMRCTWSVRELRRQWFVPEGKRDTPIDPDSIWPEGCKLYGYSLSDRWPLAENCDGFETKEQIQRRKQLEEMRKTRK